MGIRVILIISLASFGLDARPISYSGGSTLMGHSNNMKDSFYYHYSPSYKYSIGIESLDDKVIGDSYSYTRLTYLINRKNTELSQRNLYFQLGISTTGLNNNFYGVHGDWETRRFFVGFGFKQVENQINDYEEKYIQMGLAPYLGEYGDFHTWLMFKAKKNSLDKKWSNYPVLKFIKGNVLIEFGYSDVSEWDTHLMYRF